MMKDGTEKGPSKKELKKLAKKAEKQAKKQEKTATLPTPVDTAAPSDTPTTTPVCNKPMPITLALANAKDSASTWKVLWASQLYQIPLSISNEANDMAHGPFLVYGDQHVMGGNSMAKAICWFAGTSITPEIDDWCEWERTQLRHSPVTALPRLEQALEKCGGHHVVNHVTTVADICIASTLHHHQTGETTSYSPLVQEYMQCHAHALMEAKKAVSSFQKRSLDLQDPSLNHLLDNIFSSVLQDLFGQDVMKDLAASSNIVSKCANLKHGDFQCNAAMPLFAALKKSGGTQQLTTTMRSPQDVAKAIVTAVGTNHPVVTDLSINGPGFVLCRIQPAFLQGHVNMFIQRGHLDKPTYQETCLVDFSSPNIAKEMHVGHLRSTILGEAICRILEHVGAKVYRVNHVGDWGTQFGMLIQYLEEEYPNFGMEEANDVGANITDLTEFYKSAKKRFDESPEFKEASRINVVKLQSGDPECLAVWKILCDVSRKEFQKVYDRLDITVEECGESFYNDKIPSVIEEFEKAGLITIEEGGAKCVFVEGFKVPLMLQKSDGGYGYDSTDMAALKYRLNELKATRIIVITDFSQGDHFKMCYSAANTIGWVKDQKLEHIGFGTVMGEDGKRFKTRSGDTVRLVDLLDEAVGRMEASLRERIAEGKANISLEEVHGVAEAIGYSAVKYFDLSRNPKSNYKFSYDQMLDTKGDTAGKSLFSAFLCDTFDYLFS